MHKKIATFLFSFFIILISFSPTFAIPQIIGQGKQPQIAIGPKGIVAIAYGLNGRVYCVVSKDKGKTYSAPREVAQVERLALGFRRGPRIAITKDYIAITAISHKSGNIRGWYSSDRGKTWKESKNINDRPRSAREGLHAMTAGQENDVHTVWLDMRKDKPTWTCSMHPQIKLPGPGKCPICHMDRIPSQRGKGAITKLYGSSSKDGGRTWSKNYLIYQSPSGSICECCHPSVAVSPKGQIYAMWRNSLNGYRDMYVAKSKGMGQPFGRAFKVGQKNWPLRGCPMAGGNLDLYRDKPVAIFRRKKSMYLGEIGREASLGQGANGWIAVRADGPFVVGQEGNAILGRRARSRKAVQLGTGAFPVVAKFSLKKMEVMVAWESNGQIMALRLNK